MSTVGLKAGQAERKVYTREQLDHIDSLLLNILSGIDIDGHTYKYQFYGHIISTMSRVFTSQIPIAAVTISDKMVLWVNPDNFMKYSIKYQIGFILHEIGHYIFWHHSRIPPFIKNTMLPYALKHGIKEPYASKIVKYVSDIASDIAVDEYYEPELLNEESRFKLMYRAKGLNLPDRSTYEDYAVMLLHYHVSQYLKEKNEDIENYVVGVAKDKMKSHLAFGDQNSSTDNNDSDNDESDQTTMDFIKEVNKYKNTQITSNSILYDVINTVVNNSDLSTTNPFSSYAGNIPSEILEYIKIVQQEPKIPWEHYLYRFVASRTSESIIYSKRKISRKRREPPASRYEQNLLKLVISVDTSGSISKENLLDFLSEIDYIYRSEHCELTVLQFDCKVHENSIMNYEQIYYEDNDYRTSKFPIIGRGGTLYNPMLRFVKENYVDTGDIDGLIIFTDGYPYENINTLEDPGVDTLWVLSDASNKEFDPEFGQVAMMST